MRAVLLAVSALVMLSVAACGDDDEEAVTPTLQITLSAAATPSPTPTLATQSQTAIASPTFSPTPVFTLGPELAEFQEFARLVDVAVQQKDAEFFSTRGVEMTMTCQGDEQLGPCIDRPAGSTVTGIPGTAWRSDAFYLFSPESYETLLTEWFAAALPEQTDDRGDGTPRLVAVAKATASGEYYAILTAIAETGPATGIQRQSRALRFSAQSGEWLLYGERFGAVSVTAEDWLSGSCSQCYDYFEPWPPSNQ